MITTKNTKLTNDVQSEGKSRRCRQYPKTGTNLTPGLGYLYLYYFRTPTIIFERMPKSQQSTGLGGSSCSSRRCSSSSSSSRSSRSSNSSKTAALVAAARIVAVFLAAATATVMLVARLITIGASRVRNTFVPLSSQL